MVYSSISDRERMNLLTLLRLTHAQKKESQLIIVGRETLTYNNGPRNYSLFPPTSKQFHFVDTFQTEGKSRFQFCSTYRLDDIPSSVKGCISLAIWVATGSISNVAGVFHPTLNLLLVWICGWGIGPVAVMLKHPFCTILHLHLLLYSARAPENTF